MSRKCVETRVVECTFHREKINRGKETLNARQVMSDHLLGLATDRSSPLRRCSCSEGYVHARRVRSTYGATRTAAVR